MSLAILTTCHNKTSYFREAEACLEQGRQHIADQQTEAAAQSLSHALLAIDRCDLSNPEVQRLKGLIEDNLGFAYWKHELFDEALPLHVDAAQLFRDLGNDTLLMNALRNCGRTTASMGDINAAQQHYWEALQLAKTLSDTTMEGELLLELSLDVLMAKEDYGQVIEHVSQALAEGADADACHLTLGLANYYLSHDSLAITHLNEATHSDKAGVRMSAYQSLYYLYQFAGDYPKALECHELFTENMMLADREHRSEQVQRIKAEYDLQMQKNNLEAEQKLKTITLYFILALLVVFLVTVLMVFRQKTLSAKLKTEENRNQMEMKLKKNKVYVTALALSEQITANTLDFNIIEDEWDNYIELIDMVYGGFTKKLLEQYPTLNKNDLQICALTRQGFSNQVISILMNIQTASYARRKSRIKQEKMNGLQDDRSFEEIISSL